MPPKKKEEEKPKALIGRVGTNLKMGIVGLPNAGFVSSDRNDVF
jgi:obg-like ATPase 1